MGASGDGSQPLLLVSYMPLDQTELITAVEQIESTGAYQYESVVESRS